MNIFRHCVLLLILLFAGNGWAQPSIDAPSVGATLSSNEQSFNWSGSSQLADEWWLYVGATEGGAQYFDSGQILSATNATVATLPTDGSTVFVRLWYRNTSQPWQYTDSSYSAANVTSKPFIVNPANGNTLTGSSTTFSFDSNGMNVDEWWLYAGSSVGGAQYANSGSLGGQASSTVDNLPTEGENIHVRLWYRKSGGFWSSVDSIYTASLDPNTVKPYFAMPSPGSFIPSENQVFEWIDNGVNADEWWIYIGSSAGRSDYMDSGLLVDCNSLYVSGFSSNISTVYVTLWYRSTGESWKSMQTQF